MLKLIPLDPYISDKVPSIGVIVYFTRGVAINDSNCNLIFGLITMPNVLRVKIEIITTIKKNFITTSVLDNTDHT